MSDEKLSSETSWAVVLVACGAALLLRAADRRVFNGPPGRQLALTSASSSNAIQSAREIECVCERFTAVLFDNRLDLSLCLLSSSAIDDARGFSVDRKRLRC